MSQIADRILIHIYLIGGAPTSIASWRIMFFICGSATVLVGAVFLIAMLKDITRAWFFAEEERKIATERLALDGSIRERAEFSIDQFKEAIFGNRTYIYFLVGVLIRLPSPF
ncbi:hypothetical protein FQN52_000317 [Onygenales sp. PD_12]|nr:hypothetical protein FQN52_000317 [Onygenales sp. PD_12]KAK2800614.1 hypothetical protein FQN51_005997 [Onygenales sp. PD_10]